jgi:hypothetical protein
MVGMIHPTASTSSSRELLLELKRHGGTQSNNSSNRNSSSNALLPPYNLKLVRESLQDIHLHLNEAEMEIQAATAAESSRDEKGHDRFAPKPSILLHESIVRRHKRCLLAYHLHRAQTLQRQVLECSTNNDTADQFSHLTQNAPELDFCLSYHQLRSNYWQSALPDHAGSHKAPFGITGDLVPPAAIGNLQVRCVVTRGPVVLDSGRSINLTKGSVLYLPKSDIWEWVQNGTLQVLEGEEVDF